MKKILLILILLLSINVYADACYIKEDGDCILESLTDTVYDDKTGSITYNNANKTITINNYEGYGIEVTDFDSTVSIIFEGNNIFYDTCSNNNNSGLYISDEDFNVIIEGKNNSSITFNNVNYGIRANYSYSNNENRNVEIKNLNINGNNIYNLIYLNNNLINIHDCIINVNETTGEVLKIANPSYSDNNINNINNNKFNTYNIKRLLFVQSYDRVNFENNTIDFTGKDCDYLFNIQGKSNKNQTIYVENNTITGSKCEEVLLLNAQYGGSQSQINITNNSIDIDDIKRILYSKYYDIYFDNNPKLEFTNVANEFIYITYSDEFFVVGSNIYLENKQTTTVMSSMDIQSKAIYFEKDDIEIKNNGNHSTQYLMNLTRNDGYQGQSTIKDSNIKIINGTYTAIRTFMTDLAIEGSNIEIIDTPIGFNIFKDLTIFNSNIKYTSNLNVETVGFNHYAMSGILYVENTDIDIKINTTNPQNIYGFYSDVQQDIDFKNSNIVISNTITNPPLDKSTKTSYGFYVGNSSSTLDFVDTFVYVNLEENSGQVYKGYEGKFTNTSTTHKMNSNLTLYTKDSRETIIDKEYLNVLDNYNDYIASSLLIDRDDYTYDIVNGNNQEVNKNNVEFKSIKIDGNHMLFNELYINDNLFIKDTDYSITKGSTIINFTESGLNKLNNLNTGTYNIKATYTNGEEVLGDFKVINSINNPKTGDNLIIYLLLSFISFLSMITIKTKRA